jgi:hypothetical protein
MGWIMSTIPFNLDGTDDVDMTPTQHKIITDEMVEKAREAMESYPMRDEVRAALEAVAPMITAQALKEAVKVIDTSEGDVDYAKFKLLGRIEELDPK